MRLLLALGALWLLPVKAISQWTVDSVKAEEIEQTMHFLTSDNLQGRGNYSPQLHSAAQYIANRFQQAGLLALPGLDGYFHSFGVRNSKLPVKDSVGRYVPGNTLLNVVGVLEGKSKPEEVVIISAHYDHIGNDGSIYNGSNDNASGTAALLALADYYARRDDNERTIIFCAFSGEELGLLGSKALSGLLLPERIVAGINLEMIGVPQVGRKAFFITGGRYSNFETIVRKALKGSRYRVVREPSEEKELFMRSDNYPFARLGIPAHTFMASDDDDACYHKACDEIDRLDLTNMTELIKAIAVGTEGIISGKETPSRINSGLPEY